MAVHVILNPTWKGTEMLRTFGTYSEVLQLCQSPLKVGLGEGTRQMAPWIKTRLRAIRIGGPQQTCE